MRKKLLILWTGLVSAVLMLVAAGGAAAQTQTLTLNKTQTTLDGHTPLTSSNAGVGIPFDYIIVVTSAILNSSSSATSQVTITDTLPSGFVPQTIACAAQAGATCPFTSQPLSPSQQQVSVTVSLPQASTNGVTLTITGYVKAPGQFLNHAEAFRLDDPSAVVQVDSPLTVLNKPLPTDLEVDKTVNPATGTTGTIGAPGTLYHFEITVKNNGPSDVGLDGFQLADLVKLMSGNGVNFKFSSFTCPDSICPTHLPAYTGYVSSSTAAFSLPFGPSTLFKAGTFFRVGFDGTFDAGVDCGSGSNNVENDAFLTIGNSLTSITDYNSSNNTGTASLTSSYSLPNPCKPKILATKTQVTPANPVSWGQNVTYQIDFKNVSGAPLTNFNIADILQPSGLAPPFKATIASQPVCSPACTFSTTFPATYQVTGNQQLFIATFASVPDQQSATITFTIKYEAPCDTNPGNQGTILITNIASSNLGGISVPTLMTGLPDCGLTTSKRLTSANPVVLGQPVEFQINYANPSSQPVTVRTLEDVLTLTSASYGDLPIQIVAASCQATPAGSVTPLPSPLAVGSHATVKYNNPPWSGLPLIPSAPVTFAPGASLNCTVRFVPQQPTLCQGAGNPQLLNSSFIDTGVVSTSSPQQPTIYASATADLPLCRDVAIKKDAPNPQSFTPGQQVTYTIRVTNNNPNDPVSGISVVDPLPPGFGFVSATCTACNPAVPTFSGSSSSGQVQATIPTIPANGTVVITITVTAPDTGGSYDNVATASFTQQGNFFEGPGTVLASTANVQVLTPRLTKAFAPSEVPGQSVLTFTISNVGGNPLQQGIAFTDTLPASMQILGAPTTNCYTGAISVSTNAITFQGGLQAGQASCTITVRVSGSGCNDRVNISGTKNIDPSGVHAMLGVQECPLSLTIDKKLAGAPAGFTGTFKFDVTCSTSNGLVQQQVSITWPNTTVVLPGIPAGSTCFVAEDSALPPLPGGYSWTGVPVSTPANGVVQITKDGKNEISFENTARACGDQGQVKITKLVSNVPTGFTGTFNFTVTCWTGTTLITKQAQVTIPGSPTVTVGGIPLGSTCQVNETTPLPALPTGWFWQTPSYQPASGQVVLAETCCPEVKVINTAKLCCAPPDPTTQDGTSADPH